MAFILRHDDLTRLDRLALRVDAGAKVVPAAAICEFREAEQIVEEARKQAAAIVANATQAYNDECKRGYDEGRKEALLEQAERMIEHVGRTVDYFAHVETRMVDLVMGAVQKIVSDFGDRERVLTVVRNALSVVRNQKQMTLRLNPAQLETVRASVNGLLALYPGVGYLDLVSDGRIGTDACILESEIGVVEASIEGQLEAIRAAFARILGSRT